MSDAKLSEKQETFVQHFVLWRDASKAYRAAFDTSRMNDSTIYRRAYELRNDPKITARIMEVRQANEAEIQADLRTLLGDLGRIANADPSKISRVERNNCRHCFGRVQGARHVMVLDPLSDQLPPRPHIEKPQPVATHKGGRK